jgi:hypothetical protein
LSGFNATIEDRYRLSPPSGLRKSRFHGDPFQDVHHNLGGSLARLEGLYLLEIMDGAKFKHKDMWDLAFAKADIYRRKIQTKYIDSVHLRDLNQENKNLNLKS